MSPVSTIHRMQHDEARVVRLPVAPPFDPALRLVGRKQRASDAEVARNPRARSAILRVAERTAAPPVALAP